MLDTIKELLSWESLQNFIFDPLYIRRHLAEFALVVFPSVTAFVTFGWPTNEVGRAGKISLIASCVTLIAWQYLFATFGYCPSSVSDIFIFLFGALFLGGVSVGLCPILSDLALAILKTLEAMGVFGFLLGCATIFPFMMFFGCYLCALVWLLSLLIVLCNLSLGSGNTTIVIIRVSITLLVSIVSVWYYITEESQAGSERKLVFAGSAEHREIVISPEETPFSMSRSHYMSLNGESSYDSARVFSVTTAEKKWFLTPASWGDFRVFLNGRVMTSNTELHHFDKVTVYSGNTSCGDATVRFRSETPIIKRLNQYLPDNLQL